MTNYMTTQMPEEIYFQIFSLLPKKTLARSAEVCQDWRRITRVNAIWQTFFPGLPFSWKGDEIHTRFVAGAFPVSSGRGLHLQFKRFLKTLHLGQTGVFQCLFPFNPTHHLKIKVNFSPVKAPKVKRSCCYISKTSETNVALFPPSAMSSFPEIMSGEVRMRPWAKNLLTSAGLMANHRHVSLQSRANRRCGAEVSLVSSRRELQQAFKKFLKTLSLDQRGIFQCFFPSNPAHHLKIKVNFAQIKTPKLKKSCRYISKISETNLTFFSKDLIISSANILSYSAHMRPWAKNFLAFVEAATQRRYFSLKSKVEKPFYFSSKMGLINLAVNFFNALSDAMEEYRPLG